MSAEYKVQFEKIIEGTNAIVNRNDFKVYDRYVLWCHRADLVITKTGMNSRKPRTMKPSDTKLEGKWRLVEYFIHRRNEHGRFKLIIKIESNHSFGDHLRYQPIHDAPLHTDFSIPTKKNSTTCCTFINSLN